MQILNEEGAYNCQKESEETYLLIKVTFLVFLYYGEVKAYKSNREGREWKIKIQRN
jgi:hypothetical protein